MEEALHWVSELVTNQSLRFVLREKGLELAKAYSLERLSQRLALILAQVIEEKWREEKTHGGVARVTKKVLGRCLVRGSLEDDGRC